MTLFHGSSNTSVIIDTFSYALGLHIVNRDLQTPRPNPSRPQSSRRTKLSAHQGSNDRLNKPSLALDSSFREFWFPDVAASHHFGHDLLLRACRGRAPLILADMSRTVVSSCPPRFAIRCQSG